jgi:hypothetical protein
LLKDELQNRGFRVLDSAEAADATLVGKIEVDITLDGDGHDPSKTTYLFELHLKSGVPVWKTRIKFIGKPPLAEDNEFAAKRLAQRLASDWRNSAKKASQ